jgi:hypothetical protein
MIISAVFVFLRFFYCTLELFGQCEWLYWFFIALYIWNIFGDDLGKKQIALDDKWLYANNDNVQ